MVNEADNISIVGPIRTDRYVQLSIRRCVDRAGHPMGEELGELGFAGAGIASENNKGLG